MGGQMRNRALLVAAILVLSLAICGVSAAAEELVNDTQKTAVAVRITFMTQVFIRSYGREFDTIEPSSGLSDVFVFSGGEVRRNGSFEVEWAPGLAIKSVEWLEVYGEQQREEMERVAGCSHILSPGDSLSSYLRNTYDGMVICLEPGTYTLSGGIGILDDVTLIGLGASLGDTTITCSEYDHGNLSVNENGTLALENLSLNGNVYLSVSGTARCVATRVQTAMGPEYENEFRSAGVSQGGTLEMYDCVIGGSVSAYQTANLIMRSCVFIATDLCGVNLGDAAQANIGETSFSNRDWGVSLHDMPSVLMSNCSIDASVGGVFLIGYSSVQDVVIEGYGNRNSSSVRLANVDYALPPGFFVED